MVNGTGSCSISGSRLISGSCLISGELSFSRLIRFELRGSARAALHSAQSPFTLPCGQGVHSAQAVFRLPWGHPLHTTHLNFHLPCEHRFRPAITYDRIPRYPAPPRAVFCPPHARPQLLLCCWLPEKRDFRCFQPAKPLTREIPIYLDRHSTRSPKIFPISSRNLETKRRRSIIHCSPRRLSDLHLPTMAALLRAAGVSRTASAAMQQSRGYKVAVLGAAGGIGQPCGLLMKMVSCETFPGGDRVDRTPNDRHTTVTE